MKVRILWKSTASAEPVEEVVEAVTTVAATVQLIERCEREGIEVCSIKAEPANETYS